MKIELVAIALDHSADHPPVRGSLECGSAGLDTDITSPCGQGCEPAAGQITAWPYSRGAGPLSVTFARSLVH
jgi:hypothetical protein